MALARTALLGAVAALAAGGMMAAPASASPADSGGAGTSTVTKAVGDSENEWG